MAKFNLDNYETVEERLKQYWIDNPRGKIETNVVHITDDGTCVTIKAEVFVNTDDQYKCISTGIAQETKGQGGFANTDAWVENCETSAIGRALANWNYQGSKAPRPSRQEMSKVGNKPADVKVEKPIEKTGRVKDIAIEQEDKALEKAKQDFAKDVAQPPAPKITQEALQDMVLMSCNEDKNFANKCWKTSMEMTKLKAKVTADVSTWKESTIKIFLDNVETFVTNYADEYKERLGNTDTVNNILDVLDAKVSDNKEEEMGEVKEGPWMKEQPSEKQLKPFNDCVNKAIDNGEDELAAKAKQALADGSINKGNIFDWVDTDTWSLKDGS
tara:strand:+ start:772 stop:1758 length:987 start_codon:yes stop_codon:yes gene_type:complete